MRILLFTKTSCPNCLKIKENIIAKTSELNIPFEEIEMGTYTTEAIACYFDVYSVPTILILNKFEAVITRWVNNTPSIDKLRKLKEMQS